MKSSQYFSSTIRFSSVVLNGGGFGGRGCLRTNSFLGFDPLPTQRVPLCIILRYQNLVTDPINFLKEGAFGANTYFFEGGARAKKNAVLRSKFSKFSKKCQKCFFLACFSKFCLRRKNIDQNSGFLVLWESSENQFDQPKKNVDNFLKNPPLEKNLDPPLILNKIL